jgi:aspartate dehydrogenase
MPPTPPLRLALIGWGAIGKTVGRLLAESHIEIVAIAVRDTDTKRADLPAGATLISDPEELAGFQPDVVAEAAGRESVEPWGRAALEAGADFIVSSVSAFADPELLESMRQLAAANGGSVHIQPGALAGVEALSAARLMGINAVEHRMVKPPNAWRGTPAETLCDLEALSEATAFFSSTASEAASQFPKNANVAMTTALAGIGPEKTMITLVADPTATTNRHELKAHGAFGELDVTISNNPLPDNPKTSAMAALSLARSIQNHVAPLVI